MCHVTERARYFLRKKRIPTHVSMFCTEFGCAEKLQRWNLASQQFDLQPRNWPLNRSEGIPFSTGWYETEEFSSQQVSRQPKNSGRNRPQHVWNSGKNLAQELGAILYPLSHSSVFLRRTAPSLTQTFLVCLPTKHVIPPSISSHQAFHSIKRIPSH